MMCVPLIARRSVTLPEAMARVDLRVYLEAYCASHCSNLRLIMLTDSGFWSQDQPLSVKHYANPCTTGLDKRFIQPETHILV